MDMRTYSCILRPAKNPLHEIPIEMATKQELQLLAFIHGVESVPTDRIKPLGMNKIVLQELPDGTKRYVQSDMDEYARLARKYERMVNPGRGKQYVEDCFKVKLDGFDALLAEVNAMEAMDAVIAKVDLDAAQKAIADGANNRKAIEEKANALSLDAATPAPAPGVNIGSRVFGGAGAQP